MCFESLTRTSAADQQPSTDSMIFDIMRYLVLAAMLSVLPPSPLEAAGPQLVTRVFTVQRRDSALHRFEWRVAFDGEVTDDAVRVRLGLRLLGGPDVDAAALDARKPAWHARIIDAWDARCALVLPDGRRLPIRVDVRFRGRDPHQHIIVRPGIGRSESINWHIGDDPDVIAHEVGHLLGAYDEYDGGAQHPDRPLVDPSSIMHAPPVGGVVYPRHLHVVAAWAAQHLGLESYRIEWIDAGPPSSRRL